MPEFSISHRSTEPLLRAERPYEEFTLGYVNVLRTSDGWQMWYLSADRNYVRDGDRYLCYAQSTDGLNWVRPNLGLYSYQGERDNNILFYGPEFCPGGFGGGTVFIDTDAPEDQRYKMVFVSDAGGSWPVFGATSPDGLRWHFHPEPILAENSDTQNVCIQDGSLFRLYVRQWSGRDYEGRRLIGYAESSSFAQFPKPEVVLRPDEHDPEDLHFYSAGAAKLCADRYVMLYSGYRTEEDVIRVYLAYSSDGRNFSRLGRTPVLDLGTSFDSKGIYVGPGAIPGDRPGSYWFYYFGTGTTHEDNEPDDGRYDGGIGRFLLDVAEPPDGGDGADWS